MRALNYFTPVFFIISIIAGLLGRTSIATISLALGVAMLISYLIIDTVATYFFNEEPATYNYSMSCSEYREAV